MTASNTVLTPLGEESLRHKHLDNQITALARMLARRPAA